jgi:hypothetical protein
MNLSEVRNTQANRVIYIKRRVGLRWINPIGIFMELNDGKYTLIGEFHVDTNTFYPKTGDASLIVERANTITDDIYYSEIRVL